MTPERWRAITEIFHDAIAREPAQRDAFLAEACKVDASLKADVEAMLAAHDEAGSFGDPVIASSASKQLAPGTHFGSYRIEALIGSGGMGEVYRARDSKLGRDVALKILPTHLMFDRERRARLTREAQLLATLNHPHVAAIYGLEEADGVTALVLELVEGPTLADRIARGPLPMSQALAIARQIAEALDAAHEKGIIHRDLKPANIVLQGPLGVTGGDVWAQLLDFGLAKMIAVDVPPGMATEPSVSLAPTADGRILGTPAYMSPEQARGLVVDKRTDIWAFGCVLYEMLVGRSAFSGDTVSDTIAAVIEREPSWTALPPHTPASIRRLLERCLDKDPRRRLRDVGDARIEIEEALTRPVQQAEEIHVGVLPRRLRASWTALVSVLTISTIAALLGWWSASRPSEPRPQPLVRLDVDLGHDVVLGSPVGADAILSPDGDRLVFVSRGRLFSRRLDQAGATELAGSQGAFAPFFKPDGQWVAFFAEGKLKRVSVEGGHARTVCEAPDGRGGAWGEDDNIIAALSPSSPLSRVPSGGGTPEPLTALAPGEYTHRWPQVLPGDKGVLFTAHTSATGFDGASIEVLSLPGRRRQRLYQKGTFGRYLSRPNGNSYLTYVNRGTLYGGQFDIDRLETDGSPSPMLEGVSDNPTYGFARLDFSRTGTLVYRGAIASSVQWVEASGNKQPPVTKPGFYTWLTLSPDGTRLAVISKGDLWLHESRGSFGPVTFDGEASSPAWTPDNGYLVFSTAGGMSWIRADSGATPQPLTRSKHLQQPFSFTSDGKTLAFIELIREGGQFWKIWTVPMDSDASGLRAGKAEAFLGTSFSVDPVFSPDDRWLAYSSNESGEFQVYVRAFPDSGRKWPISSSGGRHPQWSRTGDAIFFRNTDNQIMVTTVREKETSFHADAPRLWSTVRLAVTTPRNFAVAPDGKRIATLMPDETSRPQNAASHVIFLFNAYDEIRRIVPTTR